LPPHWHCRGSARAAYPDRPITLIVPFAAGGPTDVVARIVAESMSRTLGQQLVVENVAGAGGTTGTIRAAQAAPDGYTIEMGHMGTHGAAPAVYPGLKYDPVKDFAPIGLAAGTPILVVAKKGFPAKDFKEFVAYVKANSTKLNEAHAGVGSVSFTTCTFFNSLLGAKPTRVCTGHRPGWATWCPGRLHVRPDRQPRSQIQPGPWATRWRCPSARRPSPTCHHQEGGLPEFRSLPGALSPPGTPPEIIAKLSGALRRRWPARTPGSGCRPRGGPQ
jgi:tripartite-type tricarboxylate transporter receptor subunit TctC